MAAGPQTKALDDLLITAGTVTATDSRVTGGTIERGQNHAQIVVSPVVWLEDGKGVEHAFEGGSFEDAREGHELVVVSKRTTGKIVRVYNCATRSTTDSNDLIPMKSGASNVISGTIVLTAIGILPAMLVYTMVLTFVQETIFGRNFSNFDVGGHFPIILIFTVVLSIWLVLKFIAKSQTTAKQLSDRIEQIVANDAPIL